ncbi:MAG: succinylglutamate desuccinylase/aspartoacylase family protein [Methanobrevibacter sp.]|nr:succinylglutamate desuccinylase/aspartoacylase family protein [Methanobrevibacter sp.]MBO6104869.1 succinylglutamate desuccinylase/aspartoacylase family protein [Methanobrevibacter sp.]MBO7241505.1 succinylglutamate desuccinylase/aspartoacylase family protein [Methanobrevibacter sp.]
MKKRFLALALFGISLFLLLSSVSAEEIGSDDSNPNIEVFGQEQSIDTSEVSSDDANSDISLDEDTESNSNETNNSSIDSSKTPYKFSSAKNISTTYGKKAKFSVKVLNNEGKAINHTLVTFKVSGKTYNRYTNVSGIAYLYLNLNAGKYAIKYNASGISGKNYCTVKNYYKITNYKWKSGANVLKNKRIKANVPNSALVRKIIKFAKSGTPVIKFKGGKGKVVFITAGCHGNEIPSQVAAMKLIKYLETHYINGTVYVMPFMNPKGTAANVRDYKGVHLNKKANKKGTISYKTVKLIKKFKCDAYGDFHATRPGGKPGKDLVFGTYKPTKKSATIAKYIAKNAKVKYKIYKKAGVEYPGALEDEVNLKGIPAVTCEVISPHGKIKKGSVSKSLLMMKTLLKYNKIL